MFKYIKSFFLALNANAHPGDIAHGVSLGLWLALVPRANLLWVFMFFFFLFVRVNKGSFFLTLILTSFLVPFFDVTVEDLGFWALSLNFMEPVYTTLYQTPFVGLTRFNNTMVAGGLLSGIITYLPVYFLFSYIIIIYRKNIQPMIANSKAAKIFVQLPLIKQIINAPDPRGIFK